jgi:hypothetical protein
MDNIEIQALADALVEKLKEDGIKIFPETASAIAQEIAAEHQKDPGIPIDVIVKRQYAKIRGIKEDGGGLSGTVASLLPKIALLEKELLVVAARGPITPEEIKAWRKRIYDEVYIPFQNIGAEISDKVADLMQKFEELSKNKHEAEEEFNVLVQKANQAFKDLIDRGSPSAGPVRRRYVDAKYDLVHKSEEITKATAELNFTRGLLTYLTGAGDYLKKTVRLPENFGVQLDGASAYLRQAGVTLGEISEIINALKDKKNPNSLKLKEMVKEGPERHRLPIWMARSLSNNPTLTAQEASIGPGVTNIDAEKFENSSIFYEAGRRLWEKINEQNPDMSQEEKLAKYNTEVDIYKQKMLNTVAKINKLPDTWRKFREIYEILDPEAPEQVAALHSTTEESPESYQKWHTPTSIQSLNIDPDDDAAMRSAKWYLNKKNTRAWSEIRKMAEAQNPNAHWSTLFALSHMQPTKYDPKTGKTYGEQFLSELSEEKRKDPDMQAAAQKIDGIMATKRKEMAIQVIFNPGVPDWILMRLASLGYRSSANGQVQKEADESYDFIRKLAYEMLLSRGWKLERDAEGKPVGHRLGGGHEFGFSFKKTTDATTKSASIRNVVSQQVAQQNPQISAIDQQISSESDQIKQLENQINQKRQRIKVLEDNKKPLMEEQQRAQEANQRMMSDYSQGKPVQPTSPVPAA